MEIEISEAREAAEQTLGFDIDDDTAEEILDYAKRKCALNHKPEDYLPLLYKNELTDHFMRMAVTMKGERNCVQRMPTVPMPS